MNDAPAALRSLLQRAVSGDRVAVGRALTCIENEQIGSADIAREIAFMELATRPFHVVGVTGPPGAGKSTLVAAMLAELVDKEQRVAVVAVDPSSPLTGGALLGDRTRMGKLAPHRNVYIRSVANRGHSGGLAPGTATMVSLLGAAGYSIVIVEAVGAGQSEHAVADVADINLVLFPPGMGDEIQALKAGILEIADILIVPKSDLPGSLVAERELASAVALSTREKKPRIHAVSATTGDGLKELVAMVREVLGSEN